MKRAGIFMLCVILLCGCSAKKSYLAVFEKNWNLELPQNCTEIYSEDSGPSFHGDGIRYHVMQYEEVENKTDFFGNLESGRVWKAEADEKLITEWLDEIEVAKSDRPDVEMCQYYCNAKKDGSKLILLFDPEQKRLYILENLM